MSVFNKIYCIASWILEMFLKATKASENSLSELKTLL